MNRDEVIKKLKEICKDYSDILGMVILFGSLSRNEADEKSDIDLYIEPNDRKMTTAKFGECRRYKEFKFDLYDTFPNEFDLLSYGGTRDINGIRQSSLWKQIEKDGVLIYDKRAETV